MYKQILLFIFGGCILSMLLVSCNGNKNKTGDSVFFNPTERQSQFSDDERAEAISEKRKALEATLDADALVFEHNIKLTVLPPAPSGDITEETSRAIAIKMMQLVSENGLGGYGNCPAFCLATFFTPNGRVATGTAPQRMLIKYTITYVVGNMLTGDIYGTYTQDVEGAGVSFEEAAFNAVNSIKDEPGLQEMFKTSSDRIIAWYNDNPQGFKSIVESYVAEQDYSMAYALLATVPEQAPACFSYAQKRQDDVLEEMKNQKAEELLTELRNTIASAGDHYTPMAAGCLQMIPARSKQYTEGKALYDGYVAKVEDTRRDSIKHEQRVELEKLAMEKMKLKYEQEAAMKSAQNTFDTNAKKKGGLTNASDTTTRKGGLMESFKKHPLLWGLGLGALAIGTAGVGLYAALPLTTKIGLALL